MSIFYGESLVRYHLIPPLFLVFFPFVVQFLAITGRGDTFDLAVAWSNTLGTTSSWIWVAVAFVWAAMSLKIPSKTVLGPETPFGYRPPYKDNGFPYFCFTLLTFLLLQFFFNDLSPFIYDNAPQIVGSLNMLALIFCTILLAKGKLAPEHMNDKLEPTTLIYEYYRGVELHPRILGIDVKQLTNCRIGLMLWQIFVTAFFITGLQRNGFNPAACVDFTLQTIYLGKFFWWEAGYFYTLDMMLDRSGFYICWGCLCWVPTLYTFSSYYIVAHPSPLSTGASILVLIIGLLSIFLNYMVDYEKQLFRNSPNYKCNIWGRPAKFMIAEYRDSKGETKKSALLLSGFWGVGRHVNYTFELLAAFSWCGAGGIGLRSVWPLLYFIFLFILLVHRTIRDEDKCSKKYGRHWKKYCNKVPYRLIPYVW